MSDREYIKLSLQMARYLIQQGTELFNDGVGADSPTIGDELTSTEAAGLIDDITPDSETYYWANALLSFARYVARILQHEIDNDNILRITDGEDL